MIIVEFSVLISTATPIWSCFSATKTNRESIRDILGLDPGINIPSFKLEARRQTNLAMAPPPKKKSHGTH